MDELKCPLCGKEFKNKSGLGGHQAWIHGVKKPTLGETVRDGLARLDGRLSVIEGRVKGLEGRPLPMLADPGKPNPQAIAQAILDWLGPDYRVDSRGHLIQIEPDPGTLQARLLKRIRGKTA